MGIDLNFDLGFNLKFMTWVLILGILIEILFINLDFIWAFDLMFSLS